MSTEIKTIFTDIGKVLLTNGWDRNARRHAVERFALDAAELDDRHHLAFDIFESGKMTLDEYLDYIVFYQDRPYSRDDFKEFMYSYSQPLDGMLQYMHALKEKYGLKVVAVSNEGRELNEYRIRKFALDKLIDFFVSSSFVYLRKPDKAIFKLAVDLAQTPLEQIVYIDDRPLFVQVAQSLGIKGIVHTGLESTRAAFAGLGLEL